MLHCGCSQSLSLARCEDLTSERGYASWDYGWLWIGIPMHERAAVLPPPIEDTYCP